MVTLFATQVFLDGCMVLGTNKMQTATNTPAVTPRVTDTGEPTPPAAAAAGTVVAAAGAQLASDLQSVTSHLELSTLSSSTSNHRWGSGAGDSSRSSSAGGGGLLPQPGAVSSSSSSSSRVQQRCQGFGRLLQDMPDDLLATPLPPSAAAAAAAAAAAHSASTMLNGTAAGAAPAAAAAAVEDRERLLCRVLCGVLYASGVLQALLRLQQLDQTDVAGIEPLYEQLLQQQQQQRQQRQQRQQQEQLVHQEQQQQYEMLRDYLTAATAKDCAIMITLQQVTQQQQQQQQDAADSSISSSSRGGTAVGTPLYVDASSGCCFAWQMTLVDLDLKPVSKVPVHAELDRAVLAAAEQEPQLLQQHVEDSRAWVAAACQWLSR
jgi:hypothetical protein